MNTKKWKTGARLGALLLCLCLMMGLLPATASAEQEEPIRAIQLVDGSTPNITGYDATTKTYDYIYYGTWEGSPIKWRVLDNATNTGEAGLFLLTDVAHIEKGNGLRFDVTKPDDPGMSIWETSDARIWCTEFYTNNLSALEQGAVLATTKSDEEFVAGIYNYRFAASYNILNGDKVFFLSAEEASNAEYGFVDDYARRADSTMSVVWGTDSFTVRGGEEGSVWNGSWWLRNDLPYGGHTQAGFVYYWGGIGIEQISEWPMAARPAFNMDLDSVLLVSSAEGGKSGTVGSLEVVGTNDSKDWKVTVKDKSRGFAISDVEVTPIDAAGERRTEVEFAYTGAVTGPNEYLSAAIVTDGVLTHYGRVIALDGTVNQASGTAVVTVPDDANVDGTNTKLYVFNEQINADKVTDYASRLIDVLNPEAPEPDNADPITLPVRVLEEGDADYSPAPELSATFTPDTAVTVGEFNQWQGLAIDYYNPMVDAELSEGYDIQAGYTVSIPLENYEGTTLSGTLTIPLPQGYDGDTAHIKGGASASSHTATTVSFPVTLNMEFGTTASLDITIEYKEAQESNAPVIIEGANGTWQKDSKDGLTFTSNAEFSDFIKVQVDGKDVAASNYTVKKGSTIVTLNPTFLGSLSAGKHTLAIVSTTGTAITEFTITAAQTGGDDQTGGSDQTGSDTTPQRPDRNGGGGSSSSYREREYDFWMDVRDEIRHADPGDTVKANARTYDRMPWSVMEALSEADGVTLHITWNGGEDIIIPSEAALSERNRVYYPLSYLEEMTFEVEPEVPAADLDKINPETGGILTETPELAEKGIEQPLPGVYEPEEATASPAEETGTNGLLIASAVVALAAAGGGFWYWKRRTVR